MAAANATLDSLACLAQPRVLLPLPKHLHLAQKMTKEENVAEMDGVTTETASATLDSLALNAKARRLLPLLPLPKPAQRMAKEENAAEMDGVTTETANATLDSLALNVKTSRLLPLLNHVHQTPPANNVAEMDGATTETASATLVGPETTAANVLLLTTMLKKTLSIKSTKSSLLNLMPNLLIAQ